MQTLAVAVSAGRKLDRNSALLDLAAELPAVVLSNLLGIHVHTATAWATEAGNTRPGYAAELARRNTQRPRTSDAP
ncbi:hypothetical protein ACIO02_27310 [Streptomyces sp. NPDC087568]|uniref:hypothetical protein n=1 Tax=unclassified Streptomyces TaxID=2593676 RepID=UPI0038187D4B